MRKLLFSILLLSLTLTAFPATQRSGRSSSTRSSKSSSSKASTKSKSTKPKAPAKIKTAKVKTPKTTVPKKSTVAARNSKGKIARSAQAKKQFEKQMGYPKGRKGYVVDHIVPLECGVADVASNMQWQTSDEARIKDRTERNCRRE